MSVFNLEAMIGMDTSDYDAGLEKSEKSFLSFGLNIKDGIKKVADITTSAVSAVASGVTKMAEDMISSSMELADYGDSIDKTSQKLGISAKAYQEWDAVMQHSGTSMESMTATFKTLANATQDMTDDQAAAFERLGMNLEEVKQMSVEDLFKATITQLQGMGEGAERTALATTLLGRGAMEMGALLNTSAEDTQAMIDRVNELGYVMSDDAVKASATFNDNLQDMQNIIDGVKNGITSEFVPGLSQLMDAFTSLVAGDEDANEKLSAGFDSLLDGFNNVVNKVETVATTVIPRIVDAVAENADTFLLGLVNVLDSVFEKIGSNPEVISSLVDSVGTLLGSLVTRIPQLLGFISTIAVKIVKSLSNVLQDSASLNTVTEAVAEIVYDIAETITVMLPEILDAGFSLLQSLGEGIIENLPWLLEETVLLVKEFADYIAEAAPEMLPKIVELVMDIAEMLTEPETLVALLDAAIEIILALTEGLLYALPKLIAKIPVIIENLKNALIEAGPKLGEAAVELIGMLAAGLIEAIPAAIEAVMQIYDSIAETVISWGEGLWNAIKESWEYAWGALKPYLDLAKTWGKDLIDNFVKGIKEKWENLKKTVSDVAQTVKDFLGFSEPKEGPLSNFHTYAPDMMDLYSKGIKDNAAKLTASLEASLEGVKDWFTPDKDYSVNEIKIDASELEKNTQKVEKEPTVQKVTIDKSDLAEIAQNSAGEPTYIFNINISSDTIASDYDAYRAAQRISEELGNLQRMQALAVGA